MKTLLGVFIGAALFSLAIPTGAYALTYDVATQFDPANNPGSLGPWSYGYETTFNGTFIPYTTKGTTLGINYWTTSGVPVDFYNGTGSLICTTTPCVPAGQAGFHPGPSGEFSVYRFTAPSAGSYNIAASFSGLDTAGTTTDVYVFYNPGSGSCPPRCKTEAFNGTVNSAFSGGVPGAGPSYSDFESFSAGDMIDFAVGVGKDGTYFYDSTGLNATITTAEASVPEPSTLLLLGSGLLGLVLWRKKFGTRLAHH